MTSTFNHRNPAVKRILSEVREMLKENSWQYTAAPLDDLFEWHFTIRGPPDSAFEEGIYHGRIILPPEYPMKPPDFMFLTPNGRFKENEKFCVTISGYHPEKWQAAWTVRTALLALISLMPDPVEGIGSVDYGEEERRRLAKKSVEFECDVCGICVKDALPPIPDNVLESKEEKERRELLEKIEEEKAQQQQDDLEQSSSTANLEGYVSNDDNDSENIQIQSTLRTQRLDSTDSTNSAPGNSISQTEQSTPQQQPNVDMTNTPSQYMNNMSMQMQMPMPMQMPMFSSPLNANDTSVSSVGSIESLHENITQLSAQVSQSFNTLMMQQAQLQQVMTQVQTMTMLNAMSQSPSQPEPMMTTPTPNTTTTTTTTTPQTPNPQMEPEQQQPVSELRRRQTSTSPATPATPETPETPEPEAAEEDPQPQYSTPVQEMNRRILERHGAADPSSDSNADNQDARNQQETLQRQRIIAASQTQKRGFNLIIWGLLLSILLLLMRKFQVLNEIDP